MKTTPRILQFFYCDYFENILATIAFAKNFDFLAVVVSKLFVIKNALATNHNILLQQTVM